MMPLEDAVTLPHSIQIRGELSGAHDLLVEGDIEGAIRLAGACLTVQPQGYVRATIEVQDLIVLGRVEGRIRVTGRLDLRSGSVVVGDIFAAHLSIEDGAVLRGRFDSSPSGEPVFQSTLPGFGQFDVMNDTADASQARLKD